MNLGLPLNCALPTGALRGTPSSWMAIDDTEAALIREAAERVLRGESVWAIAGDWKNRGVPTVNGKQ